LHDEDEFERRLIADFGVDPQDIEALTPVAEGLESWEEYETRQAGASRITSQCFRVRPSPKEKRRLR